MRATDRMRAALSATTRRTRRLRAGSIATQYRSLAPRPPQPWLGQASRTAQAPGRSDDDVVRNLSRRVVSRGSDPHIMRVRPLRPTDRRQPRTERRPHVFGRPAENEADEIQAEVVEEHSAERRHRESVTSEDT